MKILYIALALLSVPATHILSNLFCQCFREARGIATFLSSRELLQSVVTTDLLKSPPAEVARFVPPPLAAGYAFNMRAFRQAEETAHRRGRSMLRPALAVVVVGSGIVGFLAVGWLGLALPIVNVLIAHSTFIGSMRGSIDSASTDRAVQHVRVVAVILHRWDAQSPREAADWLEGQPQMKALWEHLATLRTR